MDCPIERRADHTDLADYRQFHGLILRSPADQAPFAELRERQPPPTYFAVSGAPPCRAHSRMNRPAVADAFIHHSRILNVHNHQRTNAPHASYEPGAVTTGVAIRCPRCRGDEPAPGSVSIEATFRPDGNASRWVTPSLDHAHSRHRLRGATVFQTSHGRRSATIRSSRFRLHDIHLADGFASQSCERGQVHVVCACCWAPSTISYRPAEAHRVGPRLLLR